MKIFYDDLISDQLTIETTFEIDEFDEKITLKKFSGTLFKAGEGSYYLQGTFDAQVSTVCDRCLSPVTIDVCSDVSVGLEPEAKAGGIAAEYEIQDGDGEVYSTDADGVDIHEILRQEIILQTPVKKICKPECTGNNMEKNDTLINETRTPLSVLAQLKEKLEEK